MGRCFGGIQKYFYRDRQISHIDHGIDNII